MFVLKTALRYAFSGKSGQRTSNIMIIIALAVSVASVIVTASVMNGLQSDQINLLKDAESFDLIVRKTVLTEEELESLSEGRCYEMLETPVLLDGSSVFRIRGLDSEVFDDIRFNNAVKFYSYPEDGISVPYSIFSAIDIVPGKEVDILILKKGKAAVLSPYSFSTSVKSVYSCDLAEYSENTIITDIDNIRALFNDSDIQKCIYTEKNAEEVKDLIKMKDSDAEVVTWKQYNKSVYSALILEKTLMYVFLTCIFLIIAVSLKNSTQRLVEVKKTEGAVLKTMGMESRKIMNIFILQAVIISIIGITAGTFTGLFINDNVGAVLKVFSGYTYSSLTFLHPHIEVFEIIGIDFTVIMICILFIIPVCKKTFEKSVMEVLVNVID